MVGWSRRAATLAAAFVTIGVLAGCDGPGQPLSIAEAEALSVSAVDRVAEGLGLEPGTPAAVGNRRRCELPGSAVGAETRISTRGVATVTDDPLDLLDRGAELIAASGFELADPGVAATVLGRREGIRLTVVLAPTGEVAVDATTACKPVRED